jgi:hypothetical protein
MYIQKKKIRGIKADTDVAPEASELLFEAEDVAELIAEVTGEDVVVDTDGGDVVVFEVGEEQYTVEPEGTEEVLEASTRFQRGKKPVAASRGQNRQRPAAAPPATRSVRKVGRR